MASFHDFLNERNMTRADAMSVLGLSAGYSAAELSKAAKRAAMIHHPDRGGSTEMMKKVNAAKKILAGSGGSVSNTGESDFERRRREREERDKRYRSLADFVVANMKMNMDVAAYTKHFNTHMNDIFTPTTAEDKSNYYAGLTIEFANANRSKVFELSLTVYLTDLINNKSLGNDKDITYKMGVSTFAYINRKKVKITRRDYDWSNRKEVFNTPESTFPKKKIVGRKKTKFKRADMIAGMQAQINAEKTGDYYMVPLKDGKFLATSRGTMMRQAFWSIHGVWEMGKATFKRDKAIDVGYFSFPESEETLEHFIKASKMDTRRAVKYLQDEYKKWMDAVSKK